MVDTSHSCIAPNPNSKLNLNSHSYTSIEIALKIAIRGFRTDAYNHRAAAAVSVNMYGVVSDGRGRPTAASLLGSDATPFT